MTSYPADDLDDPRRQRLLLQIGIRAAQRQTPDVDLAEEAAGHAVTELHRLPVGRRPAPAAWAGFVRTAATRYAQRADQRWQGEDPMGAAGSAVPGGGGGRALERLLQDVHPPGSLASRVASVVDLRACMGQLDMLDVELLSGRYVEDLPSKELAARHRITVRSVDHRVSRAKERLRECLAVATDPPAAT